MRSAVELGFEPQSVGLGIRGFLEEVVCVEARKGNLSGGQSPR